MKRPWLGLVAVALQIGCVSTRVDLNAPDFRAAPARPPDYVDYFDYYAFGLVGRNEVDLGHVCSEETPRAVEQVRTVEDGLITLLTLGIYAPVTVRAWCE